MFGWGGGRGSFFFKFQSVFTIAQRHKNVYENSVLYTMDTRNKQAHKKHIPNEVNEREIRHYGKR